MAINSTQQITTVETVVAADGYINRAYYSTDDPGQTTQVDHPGASVDAQMFTDLDNPQRLWMGYQFRTGTDIDGVNGFPYTNQYYYFGYSPSLPDEDKKYSYAGFAGTTSYTSSYFDTSYDTRENSFFRNGYLHYFCNDCGSGISINNVCYYCNCSDDYWVRYTGLMNLYYLDPATGIMSGGSTVHSPFWEANKATGNSQDPYEYCYGWGQYCDDWCGCICCTYYCDDGGERFGKAHYVCANGLIIVSAPANKWSAMSYSDLPSTDAYGRLYLLEMDYTTKEFVMKTYSKSTINSSDPYNDRVTSSTPFGNGIAGSGNQIVCGVDGHYEMYIYTATTSSLSRTTTINYKAYLTWTEGTQGTENTNAFKSNTIAAYGDDVGIQFFAFNITYRSYQNPIILLYRSTDNFQVPYMTISYDSGYNANVLFYIKEKHLFLIGYALSGSTNVVAKFAIYEMDTGTGALTRLADFYTPTGEGAANYKVINSGDTTLLCFAAGGVNWNSDYYDYYNNGTTGHYAVYTYKWNITTKIFEFHQWHDGRKPEDDIIIRGHARDSCVWKSNHGTHLAVSPDGNYLLSTGNSSLVYIKEIGQIRYVYPRAQNMVCIFTYNEETNRYAYTIEDTVCPPYRHDDAFWNYTPKTTSTEFGRGGLSIDGQWLAVGCHNAYAKFDSTSYSSGAGFLLMFRKVLGEWVFFQKIVAEYPTFIPSTNGYSGSMAIVSDTDSVLFVKTVGAWPGGSYLQRVFMYSFNGTSWVYKQDILPETGNVSSMSYYKGTLVVGDRYVDTNSTGGATLTDAGAAFIYELSASKQSVVLKQKITAANRVTEGFFGSVVQIYGNYIFVGHTGDDFDINQEYYENNAGSIEVFQKYGSSWIWLQKICQDTRALNDKFPTQICAYQGRMLAKHWIGTSTYTDKSVQYRLDGVKWVNSPSTEKVSVIYRTGSLVGVKGRVFAGEIDYDPVVDTFTLTDAGRIHYYEVPEKGMEVNITALLMFSQ
jgi:hypothetical protein